jgi:uncharacterized protein YecT (DUF1311 family)
LWVQYRDANCAFYGVQDEVDPAGPGSRMHTLDDGRPGARTRKGDKVRLDRLTLRS